MRRRIILLVLIVALLTGAAVISWNALGMPPVRLVLKYGYPSPMGPTGRTVEIEGVEFVEISPGYFRMGSHRYCERGDFLGRIGSLVGLSWGSPPEHTSEECPPHWVEFADGFWLSRYEVTNEQYERIDPKHERIWRAPGNRHPVVNASWVDAHRGCARLAELSGLPVRLPSEAEWDCACRCARDCPLQSPRASRPAILVRVLSYRPEVTAPVGSNESNAWGLFDLDGNAAEWCEDLWHLSYEGAPADGSTWAWDGHLSFDLNRGFARLVRESAGSSPQWTSGRSANSPEWTCSGFRPAFTIKTDAERAALEKLLEKARKGE